LLIIFLFCEKKILVTISKLFAFRNFTYFVSGTNDKILLSTFGFGKKQFEDTLNFFKKNPPDVFFIYSSKSAKNLFNLINKYSLLNIVTHSNLMCISEKALLVLKQIKWKNVFIFSPGEEEFLLNKIR